MPSLYLLFKRSSSPCASSCFFFSASACFFTSACCSAVTVFAFSIARWIWLTVASAVFSGLSNSRMVCPSNGRVRRGAPVAPPTAAWVAKAWSSALFQPALGFALSVADHVSIGVLRTQDLGLNFSLVVPALLCPLLPDLDFASSWFWE